MTLEFRLLMGCARVLPSQEDEAVIREMLRDGLDWTLFARTAMEHGLAALAGRTLNCVAPDMVPDEIRDAFNANLDQTRQKNRTLFNDFARVLETLAKNGVEAIPFKGPVLAFQVYGDLGLGMFGDPHVLIRDLDLSRAVATLGGLGYERNKQLTAAQLDLIHRLQGHETLLNRGLGVGLQLQTRLTPMNMALDLDYGELWSRARRTAMSGLSITTLSVEDDLFALAIDNGKDLWPDVEGACGVAAFIGSHPNLDWAAILDRARLQGCLRMVLLAAALARIYFGAAVPDAVTAEERGDPKIEPMVQRVMAHWLVQERATSRCNRLLLGRLRLHDGVVSRVRCVARTLALPGPLHVSRNPFPGLFTSLFAYFLFKIAHDFALLPVVRASRYLSAQAENLRDACASHEFALALMPISAEMRLRLRRHHEARANASRTLAANPSDAGAWFSLGNALHGLKRHKAAIACYDQALSILPDSAGIWNARGAAIRASKQNSGALDTGALDPQDADSWARRAGFLLASHRFGEAGAASDRALAIDPNHLAAMRMGIRSRISACDWHRRKDDERRIAEGIEAGLPIITPFNHRTICDSEAESLAVARLVAKGLPRLKALWRGEKYHHDRIRIAYLSAEFHEHPMTFVTAGVYEHHDKTNFETIAISLGPNSESKMRRRIEATFDRFTDARAMGDAEVATMLRDMEVDIAIDLNGYAGSGRTGILAHRPAPVQVNFVAYSGTMGTPFLDYIIADRMVIPEQNRIYYAEQVVYLPHSFMPTDGTRAIAKNTPTRTEAGLPETGFVFACHNTLHKIGPDMFDIWMRVLRAVEGSVLWLASPEPSATGNLLREAKVRGVAPERLIFAPRLQQIEDHLARLSLATLFLDTLPYNAHATTCDALWAGLPVLTCMGNTFAGRVAASLLEAIGLKELITSSLAEYEELALALAGNPERLAAIKEKLLRNRQTEPLFDTARYTRDLESAYTVIWERTQRGEPPESFSVGTR